MKSIIYGLLLCILFAGISAGVPVITPTSNISSVVTNGAAVTFSFSSTEPVVTSHFIVNGVDTTTALQSITINTFNESASYYNVTAYAVNANGTSNVLSYRVTTTRYLASAHVGFVDDSRYDDVITGFKEKDYEALLVASVYPFTDLIGRIFYLILFAMPFVLLWKQQERMTIPTVLALITGCLFIGYIPEQFKDFIVYAIILSFGANFYFMTRERR